MAEKPFTPSLTGFDPPSKSAKSEARDALPTVDNPTPKEYKNAPKMGAGVTGGTNAPPMSVQQDPAFAVVSDKDNLNADSTSRVQVILRDIPLISIQHNWSLDAVAGALSSHMVGFFSESAQMADSILGDDRVQATLGSRIGGLFGSEIRFKPANDSAAAKEACEAWQEDWDTIGEIGPLVEMSAYSILLGFAGCQLAWDTTGDRWVPHLRPWHARYSYFNWSKRRYIAFSQDGDVTIQPGDGKWLLHTPFTAYRGWIRGAIRALAEPWIFRHFAIRDWARYTEIHGIPFRKLMVPAAGDRNQIDQFVSAMSQLGRETTVTCPQGVAEGQSYDVQLVEAKDTAWEAFPGLRDQCDMSIVLAILFQNLTTEVTGGSKAAMSGHMDIRQGGLAFDNKSWRVSIRNQVAKPWAYFNFGDSALAPWTDWDVRAKDDYAHNAAQFSAVGTGLEVLRRGGFQFKDPEKLSRWIGETFGLRGIPDMEIVEPVASGGSGAGGAGGPKPGAPTSNAGKSPANGAGNAPGK